MIWTPSAGTISQRWNNVDPGTYFTSKIWSGISREISEVIVWKLLGPSVQQHTIYFIVIPATHSIISFPCTFAMNAHFEHCVRHAYGNRSFICLDRSYLNEVRRHKFKYILNSVSRLYRCSLLPVVLLYTLRFSLPLEQSNYQQKLTLMYADSTCVFMTADMHWFAFVWLAYSGNKFFGGPKLNVTNHWWFGNFTCWIAPGNSIL